MTTRARPVRHQPRAAVPRRRVRRPARARGRRVRADRRRRAPRRRRGRRRRAARSRSSRPPQRGVAAARRLRPLPRGRRRPLRPRRAARRLRRRAPRAASRSCCGRRSGRTRAPPAHALSYLPLRHLYRHADAIATYGPHVSAYVRAKGARGPVFEAPQSVDDAFWSAPADARASGARSRSCLRADWLGKRASACSFRPGARSACQHRQPRWFWSATARSEPGPSPPARSRLEGRRRRRSCATSTRAATLWSCRRSPRATSWSRGASSSTKPSTRESP